MELELNKKYWILVDLDHDDVFDKKDFEKLIEVIYKGPKNADVVNTKHIFMPCELSGIDGVECSGILMTDIEQWVYNNHHEYLAYLVKHTHNLNDNMDRNISFDDFMIKKISESQKNFPEYWV